MKTIVIGDLHGKTVWEQIEPKKYDKIIFLGDYVDNYDSTDEEIIENLKAIIKFKKQHKDKVVLLIGNHDIQYMDGGRLMVCSGYRDSYAKELNLIFQNNEDLFLEFFVIQGKNKYGGNNYVFSHAGFSRSLCEIYEISFNKYPDTPCHIGDRSGLYNIGKSRGGLHEHGGIFWADKSELESDYLPAIHQVVGHSKVKDFVRYGDHKSSIAFVDCLDSVTKFYEIDI